MARIVIDGRVLAHSQTSGVERYVAAICRQLTGASSRHKFVVLRPPTQSKLIHHLWEHVYLPLRASANECELLFCPANIAPALKSKGVKLVLTIHGLAFRYSPESYTRNFYYYYSCLVPRSLKNADAVIAVSNAEKNSILAHYPWVPEGKIHAVPSGIDREFFSPGDKTEAQELLLRRYGISDDFVLAVGAFNPVKNFTRLLQAYSSVADRLGAKLVLICGNAMPNEETSQNIRLIGYVGADMPSFYRAAKCLVCPSTYEGFGFPALEAMACGCPVIASKAGALPEVCGDAAYYIEPTDERSIASALVELLSDENRRNDRIQRGFCRVENFTWQRTAASTLKVFDAVLAEQ